MPNSAAKLARLFAVDWSRAFQYRTDAFLWMLAEAAVPLVALAIWYTVAQSSMHGPAPTDVLTYYLLVIFIKIVTDAWNGAFMARDILNGEIVKDLIRPMPVIWRHIVNNITEKSLKLFFPLLLIATIVLVVPQRLTPAIYQPINVFLFVISLALAASLQFLTDVVIGNFAFWLEDVFQIRRYKMMLDEVASGALIPFVFLPASVATAFSFLPFRYIISAPAEILMGQPINQTPAVIIAIQLAWIISLALLARLQWRQGLKRYAIPGQ